MSRNPTSPRNFQTARSSQIDLMKPGPGTPWEDRGMTGVVGAFFKTCFMGMSAPVKLLHAIRRPETATDATWFAGGCGAIWAISSLIHNLIIYFYYQRHTANNSNGYYEFHPQTFWMGVVFQFALVAVASIVIVKFIASLFHKLAGAEEKHGMASPILTYNAIAYCSGPSLLSVIPIVGPPIALLWIGILFLVSAIKRLHIKPLNAVICMAIVLAAVGAIGVGVYFLGGFLWTKVTDGGASWYVPPKTQTP